MLQKVVQFIDDLQLRTLTLFDSRCLWDGHLA
jgi:hypothetical protein